MYTPNPPSNILGHNEVLRHRWEVLQLAEENLRFVRRSTGLLENRWRVLEAASIRDKAQKSFDDELKRLIEHP